MFCSNCGKQLAEGSRFCEGCGLATGSPPPSSSEQVTPYPPRHMGSVPHVPVDGARQGAKADVARIIMIASAAVIALSIGAYFLFFAGGQAPEKPQAGPVGVAPKAAAAAPTTRPEAPIPQPTPENTLETVANAAIKISAAFDSGEGVYTGEVNSEGAPHGKGGFIMQKSDKELDWSYEGNWENGAMTGEGVKKDGGFVFTGSFRDGLLNGECEITDDGILRYKGMCRDGKLHGQGTLYAKSGTLIFTGLFENDMLVESETERKKRGEYFKPQCEDMDELMYDACMAEDNILGYSVHVWGFPLGMAEQAASGTVILGHFADDSYPVCLLYRYAVDEPKMTGDDWVNAWGVVTGLFEYTDANGNPAICPQVEVVCWDNEQEGL